MTRRPSKRALADAVDELETDAPDEPPEEWMRCAPRELWDDPVAALRYWGEQADAAERDEQ